MTTQQNSSTQLEEHSNRAHALLSASSSKRWINCPPSARLEDKYSEKKQTAFTREGTLAHELAELYIRHDILENITETAFETRLEELMSDDAYNDEMLDYVPIYTDYCASQFAEAKTIDPAAILEVEQKVDFTEYVPEGFGTTDACILSRTCLEVIDLKYGKGVPVYADYNTQLMLYGLGALLKYGLLYDEIKTVKLTIVQPRLSNISTYELPVEELYDWAVKVLEPAAKLAYDGQGELNAGEWCKFCAVKNRCRKLYEQQLEIAKYEFTEPELLSDEDISDILKRTPELINWANSVVEFARNKALTEGKVWPGFKLVEGISRRKWLGSDDETADSIVERIPEISSEDLYDMKLKSISAIEKLVGKKRFNEVLGDIVVKPQGAPTLVPVTDKRPAMGIEDAINDFK